MEETQERQKASTERRYAFFQHTACEYFPCHETARPEEFNCLFCYCPLYTLGERCGGDFSYTKDGVKDCTGCMLPHRRKSYAYIIGQCRELSALAKRNEEETPLGGNKK